MTANSDSRTKTSRHGARALLVAALLSLPTACGFWPQAGPTIYSLAQEVKDNATGHNLRLWHYSEGMLDSAGHFLEVVANDQPVQPHIGESIVWLDGTGGLPAVKYEAGCYVLAVTSVMHPVRFEQRNWFMFLFYGSGVDLKSGDSWTEMIAEKPVCFRFKILSNADAIIQP